MNVKLDFPLKLPQDINEFLVDVEDFKVDSVIAKECIAVLADAEISSDESGADKTKLRVLLPKKIINRKGRNYVPLLVQLTKDKIKLLQENANTIDLRFKKRTYEFAAYLSGVKQKFDDFDKSNADDKKRVSFVESNKKNIYNKLDKYFHNTWKLIKDLSSNDMVAYREFYQNALDDLLIIPSKFNSYIREQVDMGKCPGDYLMMLNILAYHGDKYFGDSSYSMLLDNYTCNIPISSSNVARKDFFKSELLRVIASKNNVKILSVGCGPMQELIEIVKEDKIFTNVEIHLLDLDKAALDYVQCELDSIDNKSKNNLKVIFHHRNVLDIVRKKDLLKQLENCDFVYSSGLFDYLEDRLAKKIMPKLASLLKEKAKLIVCNASEDNSSHRGYYEFLGQWNLIYRKKVNMLSWVNNIDNVSKISFESLSEESNYLYLAIEK